MNYIEVCVTISPFSEDFADIVTAQLSDMQFESFVTENDTLKCYIKVQDFSPDLLNSLLSEFNSGPFSIKHSWGEVEQENWNLLWESNFNPIIIDERCIVRASFHKDLPDAKYEIVIDPKMAFGTGHHQTTFLMLETMLDMDFCDKSVLDMGCGTGVLAILAAKMGAKSPVTAVDIDDIAVDSTKENATANKLDNKIAAVEGDSNVITNLSFDTILANINRNIILSDLEKYSAGLKSSGTLLISGFYMQDAPIIKSKAAAFDLEPVFEKSLDNWTVLKMIKK